MKWKGWEKVPLDMPDPASPYGHRTAEAIAPLIISASRSTDIPAFYGTWLMDRLDAGFVTWKSPFGGRPVHISFERTRLIVFWTKNPGPFMQHLDSLDNRGVGYYFLFTLNDYEAEGLEPRVPPCRERIDTFLRLSKRIGKGRVVWRFDPLVLSDRITVGDLLERARHIGDQIAPFTDRMVFSFVDIGKYGKVRRNLARQGLTGLREFSDSEAFEFCTGLAELNERWGLTLAACSERRDLSPYGIGRGQCISYDLIVRNFCTDPVLMEFLQPPGRQALSGTENPLRRLKDPGQRSTCRCIVSKDIGQYSTCPHLCAYCYANTSPAEVLRRYARHCADRDAGIVHDSIVG